LFTIDIQCTGVTETISTTDPGKCLGVDELTVIT